MGDYMKGHICRLLSHTLKTGFASGNGDNKNKASIGRDGLPLPIGPVIDENSVDPEEADRNIEKAREKQREMEKEKKEAQAQIERNAQKQEEREKWRKFRQDVKQSSNKGGVDKNIDVVISPIVSNPRSNNNNHQYQQGQDQQVNRNSVCSEDHHVDQDSRRSGSNEQKDGGEDIRARIRKYSSESRLETRDQQDNRIAAGRPSNVRNPQTLLEMQAERMRAGFPPTSSVYNQVKSEVQNQSHMVVQKRGGRGRGEEENFARREFFANRAAALASKNKVEALERGGGVNSSRRNDVQDNVNHDRRSNEQENNRRRHSYDESPENRIAMIKAQRDKDKDKELAEREKELQKAYEMNRIERKRQDELRSKPAMAFQIDLSGDDIISGPIIHNSSEESKINENRSRFQNEIPNREKISNKNILSSENNNRNDKINNEKNMNNKNKQQPIDLNRESANISELQTLLPRQRKMWGPPPPLEELKLATGVVSIDVNNNNGDGGNDDNLLGSPLNDETDNETGKETRKQQDKAVLKRIEQQHDRQKESREQAKEVFIICKYIFIILFI
jgi:hypothetical protein